MKFRLTFELLDPPEWVRQGMIARIVLFDAERRRVLDEQARIGKTYPWKPGLWVFYWVRSRGRRMPFVAQLIAPNLARRVPRSSLREFIRHYYPALDPDTPLALKTYASTMHLWSQVVPKTMEIPSEIPW